MATAIILALAGVALGVSALEVASLCLHLAHRPRLNGTFAPRVSILKPLCGNDPSLAQNIASFLDQSYPDYEILLGVRDAQDGAYSLAAKLAQARPDRVRLVLQEGEPGLNPKVNQLVTLGRHARGEVLVISDSNVRVPPGYLADLVAPLADERVGMVTSPIAGEAGQRLGGQLDALHLQTYITPAVVGMRTVARQELFIGKSMAMRRADLEAVGGFAAFSRLLAEDFALGRAMIKRGKKAALARIPIVNVTDVTVKQFFDRYVRWGLMQRWVAGPGYPGQLLTFPILLAALAAFTAAARSEVGLCAAIAGGQILLDAVAVRALSGRWPGLALLALAPLKELVVFGAFIEAMLTNTVRWRGNAFHVTRGTRLVSVPAWERLRRLRRAVHAP